MLGIEFWRSGHGSTDGRVTATTNGAERPPLTFAVKSLYGMGAMASSAKIQLMGLLLIFYNQMVGLPGPVVSLALSIALLFDAVWDPIIGQLSDGTRTPWGRRHPYIYGGAIPVSVCFAFLFLPPVGWPPRALFFYLLVMIVLVRALDSVHEIPSTALWGPEPRTPPRDSIDVRLRSIAVCNLRRFVRGRAGALGGDRLNFRSCAIPMY